MLYRIYTENKNYEAIEAMAGTYFPDGFTISKAEGYWLGGHEHSLIIDIVTDDKQSVFDLAWNIKKNNAQDDVLVVTVPCDVKFV